MNRNEAEKKVTLYQKEMTAAGLSRGTIDHYLRNIHQWLSMQDAVIDAASMHAYKEKLLSQYAVSSVNLKVISVNRFLRWLGRSELALKTERVQQSSSFDRVITKHEYEQMIEYARSTNRMKMFYVMRTIALTGIRVGELQYITVEAVKNGSTAVYNKRKHRQIYLPPKLCRELLQYCRMEGTETGVIFCGRTPGKAISPSCVWRNLKYIAVKSHVPAEAVYPHSFRHLFAKAYMQQIGDITELSDLLGHSRLETTRLYTRTSADEKRRNLDQISL